MFLDIKGRFDKVDHSILLRRLQTRNVPESMVKSISNFIFYKQRSIIFPSSPREMRDINTRIPQGSPLSPILFVIYVEPIHTSQDSSKEFISSHGNDIQVTVSSNSW